jgi:hypothetical protein
MRDEPVLQANEWLVVGLITVFLFLAVAGWAIWLSR